MRTVNNGMPPRALLQPSPLRKPNPYAHEDKQVWAQVATLMSVRALLHSGALRTLGTLARARTGDDAHAAARAAVLQHVEHLKCGLHAEHPHIHAILAAAHSAQVRRAANS